MASAFRAAKSPLPPPPPPPPAAPAPDFQNSLKGFDYSSTTAATPPIPVRSPARPQPVPSPEGSFERQKKSRTPQHSPPQRSPTIPVPDRASPATSSNGGDYYTATRTPDASGQDEACLRTTASSTSISTPISAPNADSQSALHFGQISTTVESPSARASAIAGLTSSSSTSLPTASIPRIHVNEAQASRQRGALDDPRARSSVSPNNSPSRHSPPWWPLQKPATDAAPPPTTSERAVLPETSFSGLSIDFSTGFGEELSPTSIDFSKRGSMLIDGKRVNQQNRRAPPPPPQLASIEDDESKEKDTMAVDVARATDYRLGLGDWDKTRDLNPYSLQDAIAPSTTASAYTALSPRSATFTASTTSAAARPPSASQRTRNDDRKPAKVLSADEEMLSEKVRAFYDAGTDEQPDPESSTHLATKMGARWQATLDVDRSNTNGSVPSSLSRATSTIDMNEDTSRHPSMTHSQSSHGLPPVPHDREEMELAGGLEDWKDVDSADVDRYGFILVRTSTNTDGADESKSHRITRAASSLQLASDTPRRRHTLRRQASSAHGDSPHSALSNAEAQPRPSTSQSLYMSGISARRPSSSRSLLPASRNKRLLASAMDMLTLPASATQKLENGHAIVTDQRARRKELDREEKWRRMARPLPPQVDPKTGLPIVGGGSESERAYTFDTTSPKLIDRTWKGIPDKWRATAWHCFLSTSARKSPSSLPDGELIALFHEYQTQSSPEDVQIDIDVPRTISSHIMFRRRYRGGQRLLFRVLHAMSLHVPETGYVQGMAAIAVTLLAYYGEERAFVMLVRMWELRGLGKLYKEGFGGLMAALAVFEKEWLGNGEVGKQLEQLGIPATSFGTRWYLTLFNYSVPWGAMLRVWDVFMLLGDDTTPAARTVGAGAGAGAADEDIQFGSTLDVIHATSAALIDGMRDILLESDFENAMKVLTSWIPIQDEDLLMRIARVEWGAHMKRKHGS